MSEDEYVKVDLMYSDPFLEDAEVIDGIRMAGVKDIVAMKMHVVSQGGRKKDFWDLHRLLKEYTLPEMIGLHAKRYEWEHDEDELLDNFHKGRHLPRSCLSARQRLAGNSI